MASVWYDEHGNESDHETYIAFVLANGWSGASWNAGRLWASTGPDGVHRANTDDWQFADAGDVVGWRAQCECGWIGDRVLQRGDDPWSSSDDGDAPDYVEGYLAAVQRLHALGAA